MKWIKKHFGFIESNFNVLLIIVYVVSFANYYIYYSCFNIDIVSYISLTDLLFYPLKLALSIFFTIIFIEFALSIAFVLTSMLIWYPYMFFKLKTKRVSVRNAKVRKRVKQMLYDKYYAHENDFKGFFVFVGIIVCMYLKFDIVIILFPALFIYLIFIIKDEDKEKKHLITTTMVIVVLLGTMFFTSVYEVYNKRYVKDDYSISFIENDTHITTDKECSMVNYLGQSSDYIFLYDIEKKTSLIYSKLNISEIKIKEQEKKSKFIDFLRKHFEVLIQERNNE